MWIDALYRLSHLMREGHVTQPLHLMSTAYALVQAALKAQSAGLPDHADRLSGMAVELVAEAEVLPFEPPPTTRMRDRSIVLSLLAGSIEGHLHAGRQA